MQVGSIIIFLGWTIRASFQLACIQCTSPIRRVSQIREHSCLDGTLPALPCEQRINQSKLVFPNCVSALYRLASKGNGGVHIHRGCSMIKNVGHECDPPEPAIDLDKTLDFFCSRTCAYDGCNQHSVKEISSRANGDLYRSKRLLIIYLIIWTKTYLFF